MSVGLSAGGYLARQKKNVPKLETSFHLDRIVRLIRSNGDGMPKTKIRNQLQLSENDVQAALDYGHEDKFLAKGDYNIYSVKKDFFINEERFYPAVETGLKRLWLAENFHENEYYLEETARKDSKISGRWTRPDFTMISHKKFA